MPKNRFLGSAYEHFLDTRKPFKGWPRKPPGLQAYPVYRSKCTGALVAAPFGWEKTESHRSVKLPGQRKAAKRKHLFYKPLQPRTDPKGRPLFESECTGSIVSFSKNGKTRYYWPRPPRRLPALAISTTENPRLQPPLPAVPQRRPGRFTVTLNPRVRLTSR